MSTKLSSQCFHFLILPLVCSLLVSCISTTSIQSDSAGKSSPFVPQGDQLGSGGALWEAKAQIKNLTKRSNHYIQLKMTAQKPESLRLEAYGTMGISLATMVINNKKVDYLLHTEKKYFTGPLNENSSIPLSQIEIHPALLFPILFDQPVDSKFWHCQLDKQSIIIEVCTNETSHLKIQWTDRKKDSKRVLFSGPQFEIQMIFSRFEPKVQEHPELFILNVPAAFKKYTIL